MKVINQVIVNDIVDNIISILRDYYAEDVLEAIEDNKCKNCASDIFYDIVSNLNVDIVN